MSEFDEVVFENLEENRFPVKRTSFNKEAHRVAQAVRGHFNNHGVYAVTFLVDTEQPQDAEVVISVAVEEEVVLEVDEASIEALVNEVADTVDVDGLVNETFEEVLAEVAADGGISAEEVEALREVVADGNVNESSVAASVEAQDTEGNAGE